MKVHTADAPDIYFSVRESDARAYAAPVPIKRPWSYIVANFACAERQVFITHQGRRAALDSKFTLARQSATIMSSEGEFGVRSGWCPLRVTPHA
eukprot:1183085-Prorocentrum_minimum.AAC.4